MSAKRTSWVWNFFSKCSDGKEVTCSICGAVLTFHNSTSSLNAHLKKVHKKEQSGDIEPGTSNTSPPVTIRARKRRRAEDSLECTSERQESISRATAKLIAKNMLPLSFVSSDGFREFMEVVEPGYKVPSEQSIRSRLQLIHNDVKAKIDHDLNEAASVSITVDEWTSRRQDVYLSIEAQYIDENVELCSVTLCNEQLEDRPNAENISSAIEGVLAEWNLLDKTQAIIHDSASVMNAASEQLSTVRDSIKCSAHLLQLVIKDAFDAAPAYKEICKKARTLTGYFHRSNIAKTALSNRQVQLGMKENMLIQCCETRWNSKFYMCERLLLNRNAICLVLADRSVIKAADALKLEMRESEWEEMRNLISVLKPFDKATAVLCCRKNVTLSLVRPLVHRLIKTHMASSSEDNANISKFKKAARDSLYERFDIGCVSGNISSSLIASFFDPRYKNLSDEDFQIKEEVYGHIKCQLQETNAISQESRNIQSTDMDFLFDCQAQTNTMSQIDCYMAEPQIGHNMQPLAWWKNHRVVYPQIFTLAMKYLSIPATSAESERTFSIAGNIVTPRRSCLSPQNVSLLTFLYNNKRFMADIE